MDAERTGKYLIFFLLLAFFFLIPSVAWSQASAFIPRITYYGGEFELEAVRESNEYEAFGRTDTKVVDTSFLERITLSTTGFVYHPRFVIFLAEVSGGLKQENIEGRGAAANNKWKTMSAIGYNFRMMLLPEHPYNLEFYAKRRTPLARGLLREGSVNHSQGAIFTYKKRPWEAHVSYGVSNTSSDQSSVDTTTYRGNVTHFIKHIATMAGYYHSGSEGSVTASSPSYSLSSSTDNYFLSNRIEFKRIRLDSMVQQNNFDQENSFSSPMTTEKFLWEERLNLDLPWNFDVTASYTRNDDSQTLGGIASAPDRETKAVLDTTRLHISHRLFRSLSTTYSLTDVRATYTNGESKSLSHNFGASYSKKIPWGMMYAGLNLGRLTTDRTGTPVVVNESHQALVLESFILNADNIDTVDLVQVRSKVPGPLFGTFVDMTEGTNYQLIQTGSQTSVLILSIPPAALDPLDVNPYEFQVSYSIHPGDVKYETTRSAFNMKFSLFKNFLVPYFSHSVVSQEVISGNLPSGDTESTTDRIGIQLHKAPYSATLEYENRQSNLNPSQRWYADLFYSKAIAPTMTLGAKLLFRRETTEPPADPVPGQETDSTTENTFGGDVKFTKQFTRINLFFTSNASYLMRTGDVQGYGLAFGNALSWVYGGLNLSLGANINYNETEARNGTQTQLNQYYYLKLKRKLF